MRRKKKPTSSNAEVQDAMDERDRLLASAQDAVHEVDKLQDELLEEYRKANGVDREDR